MTKHFDNDPTRAIPITTPEDTGISKRLISGALVGGAALALIAGGLHKAEQDTADMQQTRRMETLPLFTEVRNDVLILKGGADLRFTPRIINDEGDSGLQGNIATTIPDNRVLVVRMAQVDPEHPEWIAFTKPGTDLSTLKTVEDRAKVTVFANLEELGDKVVNTAYQPTIETADGYLLKNPLTIDPSIDLAVSQDFGLKEAGMAGYILKGEIPPK